MLSRERIENAINFKSVDMVPLRIYPAAGGLYEHGQKLVDMIKELGHDFGSLDDLTLPEPPKPEDFDPDGRYHAIKTDEWGTTWEFRIFGIWGHTISRPLDDISKLHQYQLPLIKEMSQADLEKTANKIAEHMQKYYMIGGGGCLFEQMRAMRREEDTLMDIELGTDEINLLADKIIAFVKGNIDANAALPADAVAFGDDFGTQSSTFFSLRTWRKFFKPRYQNLFSPVKKRRKKIFFH